MSDQLCDRCGRFHHPDAICRGVRDFSRKNEVEVSPGLVALAIVVALVASYAIGYWIGHTTPPGAM